jgi:broad specificity phosphatase PhoE
MTTVFVIRHPETTWNVEKRYQGQLDTPLSERGRAQAETLAAAFRGAHLDAVISSPLSRARLLAEQIASVTDAEVHIEQRLIEMAQGPWEGLYLDEIHRKHAALFETWYSRPDRADFPGGETLAEVQRRVGAVVASAFAAHPSQAVALVTHSVVIQVIALAALGLPASHLHRIRVSNCGVTTVCGSEAPGVLLSLNALDALYGSPAVSAEAAGATSLDPRRTTT